MTGGETENYPIREVQRFKGDVQVCRSMGVQLLCRVSVGTDKNLISAYPETGPNLNSHSRMIKSKRTTRAWMWHVRGRGEVSGNNWWKETTWKT
jgi:hypothetical protein